MVEGGEQERVGVAVVEVVSPARLAAVRVRQRAPEQLEVTRVHETARGAGDVRLAVHRGKGRHVPEGADVAQRLSRNGGREA